MSVLRTSMLALLLLTGMTSHAIAHQSSTSDLHLTATGNTVTGRWDIALRDLDTALGLDGNADGQLTWGEVRQGQTAIVQLASRSLTLVAGSDSSKGRCELSWLPVSQIDTHSDGTYIVLRFQSQCAVPVDSLRVNYRLFADLDAGHRGLLDLQLGTARYTDVLGPDHASVVYSPHAGSMRWRALWQYFVTGVGHIWSGYDHLLFLLSLLLPAVLVRRNAVWEAEDSLRLAILDVTKIVTAFTLAHSLTLGLAAFGILRVPARVSESAIALSVLAAALNNVFPLVRGRRWLVAFCFGLIHGFGFANVLQDLALAGGDRALALLGFNLGVEAGQLVIVAGFLPLAFYLRRTRFYQQALVTGGSVAIALVATLWFAQRALH